TVNATSPGDGWYLKNAGSEATSSSAVLTVTFVGRSVMRFSLSYRPGPCGWGVVGGSGSGPGGLGAPGGSLTTPVCRYSVSQAGSSGRAYQGSIRSRPGIRSPQLLPTTAH